VYYRLLGRKALDRLRIRSNIVFFSVQLFLTASVCTASKIFSASLEGNFAFLTSLRQTTLLLVTWSDRVHGANDRVRPWLLLAVEKKTLNVSHFFIIFLKRQVTNDGCINWFYYSAMRWSLSAGQRRRSDNRMFGGYYKKTFSRHVCHRVLTTTTTTTTSRVS